MSPSVRVPFVVLTALALAPFAVACDALKKDGADAAAVAPPAVAAPPVAAPAADPAAAAAAAAATTPVAPLAGQVVVTPTGVKPATAVDGGAKPADAGTAAVDGGKAAPTPTPTFAIPTAIPGFDASAFKPPAGFPSTLPTFPPPPPAKP